MPWILSWFLLLTPLTDSPPITRMDLALAYLRVEAAFDDKSISDSRLREVNRTFDKATFSFFLGNMSEAVRALFDLDVSLQTKGLGTEEERMAATLRVRMFPLLYSLDTHKEEPQCQVTPYFPSKEKQKKAYHYKLLIRKSDGSIRADRPFMFNGDMSPIIIELKDLSFSPDRYSLEIVTTSQCVFFCGYWNVTKTHPDQNRKNNLELLPSAPSRLDQALAIFKARNRLFDDQRRVYNSAHFLTNLHQLKNQLDAEVKSLIKGEDPYCQKRGDYWRILKTPKKEVPLRIYAPAPSAYEAPLPVVIALHGTGGDENMFSYGYGAGRIKTLAEKHRFLVAAPQTYAMMRDPGLFEPMIQSLKAHYKIDQKRIFVLGHSLGAGAASAFASKYPNKIRAACFLAGGGVFSLKKKTPPVLMIAAELDPIFPAARARGFAKQAEKAGLPLELRVKKNYGHTLMVGPCLEEAVEWFLAGKSF